MSFDYGKLKQKHQSEDATLWTPSSDLFMVLSVVFLLLYVVASLRSGTFSVQKQLELKQVTAREEDLKRQIQAYNSLKDDYLEKEASQDEAEMYKDLMGKLNLLQDEATEEKTRLEKQAEQNAEKAVALNKYQQMVRNIINTNLLSNKKIKNRNELIVKKNESIKEMDSTIQDQTEDIKQKANLISEKESLISKQNREIIEKQEILEQKKGEISSLEGQIQNKEEVIRENQSRIARMNSDLSKKIKELQKTSSSKEELNRKIAIMKLDNAKKINSLQNQTKTAQASVEAINQELAQAENQLQDANQKVAEQEAIKRKLEADMKEANDNYAKQMADMKENFQNKIAAERAALEGQLEKEKAGAAEKAKRLAEFKEKMDGEKAVLDSQLSDLKGKVAAASAEADEYKNKLGDAKKDHERYLASIDKLKKDNNVLSDDLKRAKELQDAKKKLAKKISSDLARKGIKANVDGKTGDVTIDFGGQYFDTDKFSLKNQMKDVLQKFVPTYSKSLFDDPSVAKEIASVEIIGFSSPTYKGKYVDPQSLSEEDRKAVAYNLDLSYHRSRSIFKYIFDKKNMSFEHQKQLLPLVKVTGRSFLAEEIKGRDIASGVSQKDFCAKYDCEKSQRVLIRFNLKD